MRERLKDDSEVAVQMPLLAELWKRMGTGGSTQRGKTRCWYSFEVTMRHPSQDVKLSAACQFSIQE
jgi:hypothetical protein